MHKNMLQYFIVVHRRKSNKMAALINPNFDFFFIFLGNESGHNEHFNGFTFFFCLLHIPRAIDLMLK